MGYHKIISVTGLGGLYELVSSKADGAIVRSLDDKTTKFIASRVHSFSQLESIEIFTTHENVNLVEVLLSMQKDGGTLPNEKDAAAIKQYFEKVYPSIDFDRVYNSDLKKILRWFSILQKNNIEIKRSTSNEDSEETETITEVAESKKEEIIEKKSVSKKKATE